LLPVYIDVTVQIPLFLVVHYLKLVVMIVFKVTKHLVWVFIQYSVLIDGFIRYGNFLQQIFNHQSVHNVCDKYKFIHNSKYYTDKHCHNHDRNIFMNAKDNLWSNNILPSSYRAVENNMLDSLRLSIFNYKNSNKVNNYDDNQLSVNKYLSIDVLTPGLNSKLEQKAMLFQENLFDILISMMSILLLSFENIHFAFQSIGIDIVRINYMQCDRYYHIVMILCCSILLLSL